MMKRRRGIMLLVVIVLIGAVALTLALMGRHFIGLTRSANFAALDVRAAQMLSDGLAWVHESPQACRGLETGKTHELTLANILPPGATGSLEITRVGTEEELMVSAIIRRGKQASRMRATCPVPAR